MKQIETASPEAQPPILVFTTDSKGKAAVENGRVVDASACGARLSRLRSLKEPGQIFVIEYLGRRAKFRVAWIGEPGTEHQGQVGVEALQPELDLWGLPRAESKSPAPSSWAGANRREAKRLSCSGEAEFHEVGNPQLNTAIVRDICVGGCYLETRATVAAGTCLDLTLKVTDFAIAGTAEVRVCRPGIGMGLAFRQMSPTNRRRLEDLVEKLLTGSVSPRAPETGAVAVGSGATTELLMFFADTLKEKGLLTSEEHVNAQSRARERSDQKAGRR